MPKRVVRMDGNEWTASTAGGSTQYGRDEFALIFSRRTAAGVERRVARFSPRVAKRREAALGQLSDAQLRLLLQRSQPSWTAPELGYAR